MKFYISKCIYNSCSKRLIDVNQNPFDIIKRPISKRKIKQLSVYDHNNFVCYFLFQRKKYSTYNAANAIFWSKIFMVLYTYVWVKNGKLFYFFKNWLEIVCSHCKRKYQTLLNTMSLIYNICVNIPCVPKSGVTIDFVDIVYKKLYSNH